MLAEAATNFILVADSRKDSKVLGTNWKQGVPIEVAPFAWAKVFQSESSIAGSNTGKDGSRFVSRRQTCRRWDARSLC